MVPCCFMFPYSLVNFFQNTLKIQLLSQASSNNLGLKQNFALVFTLECASGGHAGGTDNAIWLWEPEIIRVALYSKFLINLGESKCIWCMLVRHQEWMVWNCREDHLLVWRAITKTSKDTYLLYFNHGCHRASWPLLRTIAIAVGPVHTLKWFLKD